eukprot:g4995.t1
MGKAVLVLGGGLTLLAPLTVHAAFEYDGGRSKILFNNYDKFSAPKTGSSTKTKECPKADELSPFSGIAFAGGDILVRLNESDTAPMCQVLKRIGSAPGNETSVEAEKMIEFSKRCGPVGEYKRRIAESWSIPMYTGGLDWVNSDGDEIWVETDQTGYAKEICPCPTLPGEPLTKTKQGILVNVTKAKWEATKECWTQGCECEQTKSPRLRVGLYVLGAVMFVGLMWDFIRFYVFGIREETEEERKERKEKKKAEKEKKKKEKKDRKAKEEAEGKNGEGDEEGAGAKDVDGEDKEPKSGSSSADGDEVEGEAEGKEGEEKKDK